MKIAPDFLNALSRGDALAIQTELAQALAPSRAAWKVARLDDGDLISAPIVGNRLFESPGRLSQDIYGLGGIECELAFRIGHPLSATDKEWSRYNVLDAIDGVSVAVEICDSRWAVGFDTPRNAMLADLLANAALIVGPTETDWRSIAFEKINGRLIINGAIQREAAGRAGADLVDLVVLLANDLRNRGHALKVGDFIATGSYTGFHKASPGDRIVAEFGGLKSVFVVLE
ncbi:hypothetical protein AU467_34580 [Mesorhizobium loti]|uniref:Fumarylacetoacetase-like C-terminal domain-containing protein n=1 Tax=Rhizobium loti TaxID=381 RepID=A0A101KX49_RHILI|nr:hypothetical protein AU467_34580 [Mesorhizobium loti]